LEKSLAGARQEIQGQGGEVMLWRKLEIVVAFIALAFFAFHDYERADFLMLCLIFNRLIKEA
jgi:hypothetical protein